MLTGFHHVTVPYDPGGRLVLPVTAVCQERRSTTGKGLGHATPARDQLTLTDMAVCGKFQPAMSNCATAVTRGARTEQVTQSPRSRTRSR